MSSYPRSADTTNYSREYQYDKLGVTAHTGYRSTRVWGANRFTAAADQTISAASFYTLSAGTQYQVWAGRSLRSLKLRATGTAALPGYVTVPLASTMRVYQGKPFVVAVRLDSPGEGHPLAIEYPRRAGLDVRGDGQEGPELREPQRKDVDRHHQRVPQEQCLPQGLRPVRAAAVATARSAARPFRSGPSSSTSTAP